MSNLLSNITNHNKTYLDDCKLNLADSIWVGVCSIVVMIITPAIGFIYAGLVNKGAISSMLALCLAIYSIVTILWFIIGYSLVFGDSIYGLIGNMRYIGLTNLNSWENKCLGQFGEEECYANHYYWRACGVPEFLFIFFQSKFAAMTPSLILGAISERMYIKYCILFISLWILLVYCPVAHWIWNTKGILKILGVKDFAGGMVIHISSGFSALITSIFLENRSGFGKGPEIPNFPNVILGITLLWFGWFGFTGGSAYGMNKISILAITNTNTSASISLVVWILMDLIAYKQISALGITLGIICGLVTITPAAGFVSPQITLFIGLFSSIICWLCVYARKKYRLFDDLDVFNIHGIAGCFGALAVGLFADKSINTLLEFNGYINETDLDGNDFDSNFLLYQIGSMFVVIIYSSLVTFLILFFLTKCFNVRAKSFEEIYFDSVNLFDEFESTRLKLEVIR
jgi:Amt family ammonium transporter